MTSEERKEIGVKQKQFISLSCTLQSNCRTLSGYQATKPAFHSLFIFRKHTVGTGGPQLTRRSQKKVVKRKNWARKITAIVSFLVGL